MLNLFSDSHIYMVDASPEKYRELAKREDSLVFDEDDFKSLAAYPYATGSTKGSITLHTNEDGSPLASLFPHEVLDEKPFFDLDKKIEVPMQTLDWLVVEELKLDHVDVLKIDTEGFEYPILTGAENLLKRRMIDTIHFEFGLHQVDARNFFRDFYELLRGNGCNLHVVGQGDHQGMVFPIKKYEYGFELIKPLDVHRGSESLIRQR